MKKIKVLMVTVTFGEGSGVNSFIMNYFRNIDHSKVQIDVLAYKESPTGESPYDKEIRAAGGNVYLLPSIKKPLAHIRAIKEIIRNGKYDIIHNNSLILTIPLMIISLLARVRIRILHSHATKLGETRAKEMRNHALLPLLVMNCNRYVGCSVAAGKAMFGSKPFVVLPNVINNSEYYLSAEYRQQTREEKKAKDKIVIITVGRACKQKNPEFALKTIAHAMARNSDAVYWWIGDGPLLNQMRKLSEEFGIADKVVFWGKQSNVRRLYEAADIFFLPSLFEGLPLTGVEAQAMGLPSVVSDTVTKEMVYTDLVEYVSLEQPIDDWVAALERQIARIPDRRSYTKELKESVFSADSAGQRLEEYYKSLLKE